MDAELIRKVWNVKETLAWESLVACAREYAKFMNPHQTIVIRCDGIELSSGDKAEPFEVAD